MDRKRKSTREREKRGETKTKVDKKFLGTRKLEEGLCHESPKKKIVFHTFKHLIHIYNGVKI